ncbi:MAG: hypothetical protein QOF48_2818 [Verrucomicrobiota bacterium]|jgi:uncharacterized membrane protein
MFAAENRAGPEASASRLESVDLLRGLVMVLMALDHTRDFFHEDLHHFQPLDLTRTYPALFLTRWITHFCAPVFVFLAGTGAFLSRSRGRTPRDLSMFLLTRGLWLVFLELTWVNCFGWSFNVDFHGIGLAVVWALGWSMVALSGLVWLPIPVITIFGVIMILSHNAFDGVRPESFGAWEGLWRVLHAGGEFQIAPGWKVGAGYPLIPWIGVMAVGYGFGEVFRAEPAKRAGRLLILGLAITLAFVLVRFTNVYGNPTPWHPQRTGLFSVFSFIDCHKYPPSLCYLLMTLGPALMLLAWFERGTPRLLRPLLVFGRVPLFYYLLHLPLIHGMAVEANLIYHGRANWLYGSQPSNAPEAGWGERGFGLLAVYGFWLVAVAILYPACKWFANLKRRSRAVWLSYL